MSKNLTSKKVEYLYFLYLKRDEYVLQSYLAGLFGVTKVTVSNIMATLESEGYIKKNGRRGVRITDKGICAIEEYAPMINSAAKWLCAEYEIYGNDAIIEAARLCTSLKRETVSKIIYSFENKSSEAGKYASKSIKHGVYSVQFTVLKKDEASPSMGNTGFVKPCRLISDSSGVRLVLMAQEIRYKLFRGKLCVLWYKNKLGEYEEAHKSGDYYTVPSSAFEFSQEGSHGVVKIYIKAISSCGLLNMPESEAVIRFRLFGDMLCD